MSKATRSETSAVIQSACEWLVFMHEHAPSREGRAKFVAWLLESPMHVKEYLFAEALWSDLGRVDFNSSADADTLFQETNVVPL